MTGVLVALLVGAALLAWPVSVRRRARLVGGGTPQGARWGRRSGEQQRRSNRKTDGDTADGLLAFLDIVAPSLRAGRTPEEAVRLACDVVETGSLTASLQDALTTGRPIAGVLEEYGRDDPGSRFVARSWQMSAQIGSPLADAVECAAGGVRASRAHRRKVVAASTGARTTIRILTLLPLGGPLLAVAVGVDPVRAYVLSPTAWVCLAVGGALVVAGRAWVERLLAEVARGPVLADV